VGLGAGSSWGAVCGDAGPEHCRRQQRQDTGSLGRRDTWHTQMIGQYAPRHPQVLPGSRKHARGPMIPTGSVTALAFRSQAPVPLVAVTRPVWELFPGVSLPASIPHATISACNSVMERVWPPSSCPFHSTVGYGNDCFFLEPFDHTAHAVGIPHVTGSMLPARHAVEWVTTVSPSFSMLW
jgi:hypothetical protein